MMVINLLQVIAIGLMFSSKWIKRYEVIIAGRFLLGIYGGKASHFSSAVSYHYYQRLYSTTLRQFRVVDEDYRQLEN